jgi:hypothetical protein
LVLAVIDIFRHVYNYSDVLAANYIRFIFMKIHIIIVIIIIIVGIVIIVTSPTPQFKPHTFTAARLTSSSLPTKHILPQARQHAFETNHDIASGD